jgi:aryl-alcohol dehydrogenase-like predicted oxidoreductase
MTVDWQKVRFGATGLMVSRLGLGSSYGLPGKEVERAYERGINFMFWGLRRRGDFGSGIRNIAARDREGVVIAVQSYTRMASLMSCSLDSTRRALKVDHVDILGLGWWNDVPPPRILEAAIRLRDQGKVKHLMISSHQRPKFEQLSRLDAFDSIMVRYNAAHPGAERDVFPTLPDDHPGVLAFTATRWGSLLNPRLMPDGERVPRGSDCYRFALSNPNVHASLAGPKNAEELDEAMAALDRGALSDEERAWMLRVGKAVRGDTKANVPIRTLDRVRSAMFGSAP